MVTKIIISGKAGEDMEKKVIDYSQMPSDELLSRIREYEKKYKSYDKFSEDKDIDCGYSPIEDLDVQDDWRLLLDERRQRVLEGRVKISLNSKPATIQEIIGTQEDQKTTTLYELLQNLERQNLIKEYST